MDNTTNLRKKLEEKKDYSDSALSRTSFRLIPDWREHGLRCFFCTSEQSVKYEMEFIPMGKDKSMIVPVCNRCVLIHSKQD